MCGIIGYAGVKDAAERVQRGLEILEYRGYDSVGVCLISENEARIIKTRGRVKALEKMLDERDALSLEEVLDSEE